MIGYGWSRSDVLSLTSSELDFWQRAFIEAKAAAKKDSGADNGT